MVRRSTTSQTTRSTRFPPFSYNTWELPCFPQPSPAHTPILTHVWSQAGGPGADGVLRVRLHHHGRPGRLHRAPTRPGRVLRLPCPGRPMGWQHRSLHSPDRVRLCPGWQSVHRRRELRDESSYTITSGEETRDAWKSFFWVVSTRDPCCILSLWGFTRRFYGGASVFCPNLCRFFFIMVQRLSCLGNGSLFFNHDENKNASQPAIPMQ
jgi:hypothetical protein